MEYNKLVRDKIPDIIQESGKTAKTHIADNEEYYQKLKEKLVEETNEFLKSNDTEELADILEVVHALGDYKNTKKEDLEKIRETKAQKRGSFNKRIILEETSD